MDRNGTKVLEQLVNSPAAHALVAEAETDRVARRREISARLEVMRHDRESQSKDHGRFIEEASRRLLAAQTALDAAVTERNSVYIAARDTALSYSRITGKLEAEMRETARPEIDEFIRWCGVEQHRVIEEHRERGAVEQQTQWTQAGRKVVTWLRGDAATSSLGDRLVQARRVAEDLKLEALTLEETVAAIATIRENLQLGGAR